MSRSSAASRQSSAGSKLLDLFDQRIAPAMKAAGDLPFVAAVREGLPWSFAVLAVAFAVILVVGPHPAGGFGSNLGLRVAGALVPSFAFMAAALVALLSWFLAKRSSLPFAPLFSASACSFALALPRPFGPNVMAYLRELGTSGLFLAILACGVSALAIALATRWLRSPFGPWAGTAVAAGAFVLPLAAGFSLTAAIDAMLEPISRLGDTYVALVAIVFVETLLWTAGVHGPAVLAAFVTPVYLTMQMQNTQAFQMHHPLPYVVVVSLFLFVFPGGAGATLPLAILLAFSRVARLRTVGRASLLPALFNINEPLLFGAPVVFNPYLAIPFVAAPLVLATITYAIVTAGWVSRSAFYVPSSVPTFVSTFLATQDLRAIVLAAANILVAAVVYYPFVRAYERHAEGA